MACNDGFRDTKANQVASDERLESAPSIVVGPTGSSIYSNQTLQLTATVFGLSDTAVTWRIDWGAATLSSSGLLTASTITGWGQMQVTATSVADPSISGQIEIQQIPGTPPPSTSPLSSSPLSTSSSAAAAAATPPPLPAGSQLGWIPCAVDGDTCSFPPGTRTVLYGRTPDSGGANLTKTISGSSSLLCAPSTFGGNPNPTSWETNFCWYEGSVIPAQPAS